MKEKSGFSGYILTKEKLDYPEEKLIQITEETGPVFLEQEISCAAYVKGEFEFRALDDVKLQEGGMRFCWRGSGFIRRFLFISNFKIASRMSQK